MKKTTIAIVTGATSGFGRLFAKEIDLHLKNSIDEIWIIGRREEELDNLADELKKDVRIFPFDLTDNDTLEIIKENLIEDNISIKILINAAGFGIAGNFRSQSEKEVHDMVALNCTALTDLTKICLQYMSSDSRIINFASVAAFMPQPGFAVYAGTKSYVLSFSRALNAEENINGIYVTAVCPGPAKTNFFNIALKDSSNSWLKVQFMADPESVVKKAFRDSINKKELSVYSISMNLMRFATKALPHRHLIQFVKRTINWN